jgi:hypothetical protein
VIAVAIDEQQRRRVRRRLGLDEALDALPFGYEGLELDQPGIALVGEERTDAIA